MPPKVSILIVENEALIAKDVKMTLERLGYEVTAVATSYQEAVKHVHEQRPDLALMDINIDGNKDGIQTAKALRTHYDIPVVFLTSLKEYETIQKAKESDPFGYLVKPFRPDDLQSSIELALYNHQRTAALQSNLVKMTNAFEVLETPILLIDQEGVVEHMNQRAEELTGWRKAEKAGQSLNTLLTVEGMPAWLYVEGLDETAANNEISLGAEAKLLTRSGTRQPTRGAISPIKNSEGGLTGYLISLGEQQAAPAAAAPQPTISGNAEPGEEGGQFSNHVVDNFFFLKDKSSFYRIPLDTITYVEALGNYVKVHTTTKPYTTLSPIKEIEKILPSARFYRIHRSFIVALEKVTAVHQYDVQINDKMLPIGKTFRDELMKKIKMR